jgi:glycosyltransferase involved in cell wall biosynthesis
MWPSPEAPALGCFVRDQVEALRALDGADLAIDVFSFAPGRYAGAMRDLRTVAGQPFDIVHAHFGLSAWPALAVRCRARVVTLHGTDVRHPRSRRITQAALPFQDLVAVASEDLRDALPRGARNVAVLPCGVAPRFRPLDRAEARARLGLEPDGRYLLFPADPSRAAKRHDRAAELAQRTGAMLLCGGAIAPDDMPSWINAANAVIVPSDHEGFGLAVLEALACGVPVVAAPTGIHAEALADIDGVLCAPYDLEAWATALAPHLEAADPRIAGPERAARWSAAAMAQRVADAWRALL